MQTLNSPIELGVRSLIVLASAYPRALDLNRLVLMDYCLMHSQDLDGPQSVLPPTPVRSSELGIKRSIVDRGMQVMVRAGMVEVIGATEGILFRATEDAFPFLQLLTSQHAAVLTEVAGWVSAEFGDLAEQEIRSRMSGVAGRWSAEMEWSSDYADETEDAGESP